MIHPRRFKGRNSSYMQAADDFAIELLMPEALFLKAVNEYGIRKIKDLSDMFNVPTWCVEERAI